LAKPSHQVIDTRGQRAFLISTTDLAEEKIMTAEGAAKRTEMDEPEGQNQAKRNQAKKNLMTGETR
jgi:hypothetical protein